MGKLKKISILIAISLLAISCSTKDKKNNSSSREDVRVAYLPITHALPLIEMQQSGVKHIQLIKYGSWPELLDALNTGRVDAASVLIELAMKAKSQGVGLTAVALGHHSGNVIVVAKAIKSAADLKGKSFAIPHRCSSHYILLREMLAKNHLDIKDVNIIELSPSEMPSALASGRISGYCVAEPFGAIAISSGIGKVLYNSDQLWPNSVCCALVFNNEFLKRNPQAAAIFVKEYNKAAQHLSDKDKALTDLKTILNQQDNVLRQSLQWIDYKDLNIYQKDYNTLTTKEKQYGISTAPPTYADFVKTISSK